MSAALIEKPEVAMASIEYEKAYNFQAKNDPETATLAARSMATAFLRGNGYTNVDAEIAAIELFRKQKSGAQVTQPQVPQASQQPTEPQTLQTIPNLGASAQASSESANGTPQAESPFVRRARILLDRKIPVVMVRSGEKGAFENSWHNNLITSTSDSRLFDPRYVNCNTGAVAKAQIGGIWILEIDSSAVLDQIEKDTGHNLIGEQKTFMVRSRMGRGHLYFLQTDASIKMGNVPQAYGPFSARVKNAYVVGPESYRADTDTKYEIVSDAPLAPAPDWLVQWLLNQRKNDDTKIAVKRSERGLIEHGFIHPWLVSECGKMRNAGLAVDEIEAVILRRVHEECEPPINEDQVKQVARSFAKYEPGQNTDLFLNQKPDAPASAPPREIDTGAGATRPEFPRWAIMGTSIWDGLVAPALESSSKHAEFIYMPAAQAIMNYLSGQVTIRMHNLRLNLFVGLVSPYGEFFKSSSCQLAHEYCKYIGICTPLSKNAVSGGRTLVGQAGSPEGFALAVRNAKGNKAVLFNDELGKFASKAGIESSSFADDLLTWYESGDFGNNVTSEKNSFHFENGLYTFGWLWCTTDRGFNRHWPKLAGIVSGLEDRMFFVVSPEKPKPTVPFHDPLLVPGAAETRKRIDAAIAKKEYEFEDPSYFSKRVAGMDPRSMSLVMKFALFLTIDMGKDVIDDDVIERALALVEYRNQVSAFLEPIEADNQQGRLQKEIIRELKQHGGKMTYRDLCRNLDFNRFGLDVWNRAYRTMLPYGIDEGIICEWQAQTTTGKRSTRMVGLIKFEDEIGTETGAS